MHVQTLLESLTEGRSGKPIHCQIVQALLIHIRKYVGHVACGRTIAFGTNDEVMLSRNIWQHSTADFHGSLCQTLTRPLPEPFASGLKPRLLPYYFFNHLATKSDHPLIRHHYGVFATVAFEAQKTYLREVVAKTHPEETRKVLWEHQLSFIRMNDKDLPEGQPSPREDPAFYGFKR